MNFCKAKRKKAVKLYKKKKREKIYFTDFGIVVSIEGETKSEHGLWYKPVEQLVAIVREQQVCEANVLDSLIILTC